VADDRAGDLAHDRELGDAQRLLGGVAPRHFLQLARLGREAPHLLDQGRHLAARAEVGLAPHERAPHDILQVLPRERLDQVLEGAVGEGELHRLQRRVGGDHHDLDGRIGPLHAAEDLEAVHLRHLDVENHDVGPELGQHLQRRASAVGGGDLVGGLEQHAQGLARPQLVVDDEDTRGARGRGTDPPATAGGRETTKDSSCRVCRTPSRPPSASTRRWLTAGPTSMRLSCTICTGSKSRSNFSADTAAVREPTRIRTSWPPSGSACRPTESEIFARSFGELWVR
jgi:hypothetical protein